MPPQRTTLEKPCRHCGRLVKWKYGRVATFCDPICWRAYTYGSLEDRFWNKVRKNDGPDACWVWIGARRGPGEQYGSFNMDGATVHAHRLSWQIHFGAIPNGLHVLHRCDNRPCIRPSHLFLGTPLDNTRDMWQKGRAKMPH